MAFDLRDLKDIVQMVVDELKLDSSNTAEITRIKRDVNLVYVDEVVPFARWKWLTGHTKLQHKPFHGTGTASVTPGYTTITFSTPPPQSLEGYQFATDSFTEIYEIASHTAGSTSATLTSPFNGAIDAAAPYKAWADKLALPLDCRETVDVWHDFMAPKLKPLGLQDLRELQSAQGRVRNRPMNYAVQEFVGDEEETRYRVMRVYPAISDSPTTIHVDYVKEVSSLELDGDEPLMPIGDRIVLVYGALERAWRRARNPEEAATNRGLYENKLGRMAGKVEDSQDRPQMAPSSTYLGNMRSRYSSRTKSAGPAMGGSSYSAPTYAKGITIEGANITDSVSVVSGVTIDGRDISADGLTLDSHIAATEDAHDASAISVDSEDHDNVQDWLADIETSLDNLASTEIVENHISQAVGAHQASAISFVPTGSTEAEDVQSAIEEVLAAVDDLALDIADVASDVTAVEDRMLTAETDIDALQAADVTIQNTATSLATTVAGKADSSTVSALATTVAGKADSSTVSALATTVTGKADTSALTSHTGNTSNPHSVTKSQVGLGNVDDTSDATKNSAVATLTNKTVGDAITYTAISTPATPAAGFIKTYAKSDGFYQLDSTGTESKVGSGSGGGGINYISNPDAASNLNGWSLATWRISEVTSVNFVNESNLFDAITPTGGHNLIDGQKVYYVTTGTAIGGLTNLTYYYVKSATASDFQLSATNGGAKIDLTSDGTGTHSFYPVTPGNPTVTTASTQSTFTRSTSSPLRGTASFLWNKTFGNEAAGDFFKAPFVIDAADATGKRLALTFDYGSITGTYTDDGASPLANCDFDIYVWDVTAQKYVSGPFPLRKHLLVSDQFSVTIDTTFGNTSYILVAFYKAIGPAAASIKFDSFSVGPQLVNRGAVVTDRQAWTPTGSWTTNTTYIGEKWRIGDRGYYKVRVNLTGAPTATNLSINMPSGEVMDVSNFGITETLGSKGIVIDAGINSCPALATYSNSTSILVTCILASSTYANNPPVNATQPITFGTGDHIEIYWDAPIVGWQSNVVMSTEVSGRDLSALVYATASTVIGTTETLVTFAGIGSDKAGSWNGTRYTFKESVRARVDVGIMIQVTAFTAATVVTQRLKKNGVDVARSEELQPATGYLQQRPVFYEDDFKAGDYIELFIQKTSNNITANVHTDSLYCRLSVSTKTGSQQIAQSEQIRAIYYTASAQSLPNNTAVNYGTKFEETHPGSVTVGSGWRFTNPAPGSRTFIVNASIGFGAPSGTQTTFYIRKNGNIVKLLDRRRNYSTGADEILLSGSHTITLLQGEYIDIMYSSGTTVSLRTASEENVISIISTGY